MTWTLESLRHLLSDIDFMGREWHVHEKGDGFLIQLSYLEADVTDPHGLPERQYGRKWYVSSHASKSEIVQTCLKAAITSMEHIVREHFLYKGVRVFNPHYDVEDLVRLQKELGEDTRS